MEHISITEAKARFLHYVRRASKGETIVICRRGVPIARMKRVTKKRLAELRPTDQPTRAGRRG